MSSRAEEALLDLLAKDKSNAECGETPVLSDRTVATDQRRLLTKLRLGITAELVDYAVSVRLVAQA